VLLIAGIPSSFLKDILLCIKKGGNFNRNHL